MRLFSRVDPEILRGVLLPVGWWTSRGAVVRDSVLWLVLTIVTGAGTTFAQIVPSSYALSVLVTMAVIAAVVALTRPCPLLGVVVAVVACLWSPIFFFAVLCAAYLSGRRMPRLSLAIVLLDLIALAGITYGIVTAILEWSWWINSAFWMVFALILPWLVGVHRRQEQQLAAAGWEHAAQLEREYQIAREQARLRERSRIAQDMHDSLGHELSLIALRAGALELDPEVGERHRQGAGELRTHATAATERLQEIIGILREQGDSVPLDPASEDIDTLVDRAGASGADIFLERTGPEPEGEQPAMVDRAVYRVVQEALTNAAKHAPGARITVQLHRGVENTVVRVHNAPGRRDSPSVLSGGSGLIALAERVQVAGGAFEAGPAEDGGFAARAEFGHRAVGIAETKERRTAPPGIAVAMRAAQRKSRRGFAVLVGVAVSAVLVFGIGGALTVLTSDELTANVLSDAEFEALSVGQERGEVEAQLEGVDPFKPVYSDIESPPQPQGTICDYYIPSDMFAGGNEFLRLCYDDDVLTAVDRVEG